MWEDTKRFLNEIPEMLDIYLENIMRKSPELVKVKIDTGKGTFYEYAFKHNSYECFVRLHKTKKPTGEIMAFNNATNTAYYKRIDNFI